MEKELKDYIEKVATSVINKLNMNSDDKTYTYEEVSVTKNNGMKCNGFTVIESDNNIAPSFYVNTYFESNEDVNKVADMFYDIYLESVNDNTILTRNNIIKNIGDFDLVKDNIFVFLCNYAKNSDFEGPSVKVGDLMIRFKIIVRQDEDGLFTIPITKEIYDKWNTGLTSEEFLDMAYANTKRLFPLKISNLEDIINDKLKEQGLSLPKIENEMYVVTNDTNINGAIYMLDNNVLSDLSDKMNSNKLIILPSSIHETIVIPYNDAIKDEHDMEYISHMIEEVNVNELSDDEYLSDTPYVYDKDTNKLVYTDNEISIPFIA
jgi:hypothetical protein